MSADLALWVLLYCGMLILSTAEGSVRKRQKRSSDIQKLDCDTGIEKAGDEYIELYWKVKGDDDNDFFAYCNRAKVCNVYQNRKSTKSLLEDKRIQVLSISKGTLSIKRTLPQKKSRSVNFVCRVETAQEPIINEVKIYYSLECPKATPSPFIRAAISANGSAPVVETKSGKVVGKLETLPNGKIVYEYLGIPYAESPEGKRRFAAPRPVNSWPEIKEVKEFGPACPQPHFTIPNFKREKEKVNEDCLFLNVFVPKTSNPEGKMAVMVWIHGGGQAAGSSAKFRGFSIGSSAEYPAHILAAYNDVIVVTFNYRLGILGYLNIPGTDTKGNYGMFDQIEAMQWVQNNIVKFDGDPNKVTVFGEGAGATSVALHLISSSSKSKGLALFQRAIMQSGAASAPYLPGKPTNGSVEKLATVANCPFDSTLIACLRGKSTEEIISLQSSISLKALMELSNPVIDSDFILDSPQKLYKKGNKIHDVQIMTGFTTHESSLDVFLRSRDARQNGISSKEFQENVTETLKEGNVKNKIVEELVKYQYADNSDTTARDRMIDFQSDFMTVAPMIFEAKALVKAGRSVYFYVFEHRPDFSSLPEWAGAFHGADIGFVFGAPFANISSLADFFTPKYSDIEKGLSWYIMKLWTDFAKFGTPNGSSSPVTWPQFTKENQSYLALGVKPKEKQKYRTNEVAFWNHFIPRVLRQMKREVKRNIENMPHRSDLKLSSS